MFSVVTLLCVMMIRANAIYAADLDEIALQYIKAVNEKNYLSAAKVMHYPEELTGNDKLKEVRVISKTIEILVDELGVIESFQPGDHGRFVSVFVMAGTLDYWRKKMDGLNLTYRVHFSKKGAGYLFFRLAKIESKYVLRAVEYGLPSGKTGSLETITLLTHRLTTEPNKSNRYLE